VTFEKQVYLAAVRCAMIFVRLKHVLIQYKLQTFKIFVVVISL